MNHVQRQTMNRKKKDKVVCATRPRDVDCSTAKNDSPSARGLCSNCENSGSCNYPKPEGGVWHCEEYK